MEILSTIPAAELAAPAAASPLQPQSSSAIARVRANIRFIERPPSDKLENWEFLRVQELPVPSSVAFGATFPPGKVFGLAKICKFPVL
jgi:hypothetical protein